ncbi:hypothetical protein AMECASPLE_007540, partial [Ameca splendens]
MLVKVKAWIHIVLKPLAPSDCLSTIPVTTAKEPLAPSDCLSTIPVTTAKEVPRDQQNWSKGAFFATGCEQRRPLLMVYPPVDSLKRWH